MATNFHYPDIFNSLKNYVETKQKYRNVLRYCRGDNLQSGDVAEERSNFFNGQTPEYLSDIASQS